MKEGHSRARRIREALRTRKGIHLDATREGNAFIAKDGNGNVVTSGFGKGAHAYLGAFGECLEHLHMWLTAQGAQADPTLTAPEMITIDDIFVRFGLSLHPSDRPFDTIDFTEHDRLDVTPVPITLVNVFFNRELHKRAPGEQFYTRYASSNGTAFGFANEDAVLHSLLEIVERHELSRLFLSILELESSRTKYSRVVDFSFNAELEQVVSRLVNTCLASKVLTLLIESEFGAYFSFSVAEFSKSTSVQRIWGAGSSIHRDLAIYRSLTECLQMASADHREFTKQIDDIAGRYPIIRRIKAVDIRAVEVNDHYLKPLQVKPLSVSAQVDHVAHAIRSSGRKIYYFAHEPVVPSYHVVTTYVTNVEKFFGILHSIPVLPMTHLQRSLS